MIRRAFMILMVAACLYGQDAKNITSPDWTRPFPGFRIVGNVYYVGTYDLACYLIVTPAGNILINTGVAGSAQLIRDNIERLGFKFTDTKLLLTTQAHWDHVYALAEVKRMTGARVAALEQEVPSLESGGKTDFRFGEDSGSWYEPVKVEQKLHDKEKISMGGTELTVYLHPGHTEGASSYGLTVTDGGRTYNVLIANMGSINPGVTLLKNAKYPNILADYAHTFQVQKELHPDIFLASHAGQFDLHRKYQPGDPYQPARFVDPAGYRAAVEKMEQAYNAQVKRERAGR